MKEATEEQDLINESKKLTKVFVFLNKPWFIILIFGTILSVCLTTIILTYFSGSGNFENKIFNYFSIFFFRFCYNAFTSWSCCFRYYNYKNELLFF